MMRLKLLRLCSLVLLAFIPGQGSPMASQCVDETFCLGDMVGYQSQLSIMLSNINERSIAPWTYVKRIDLDRLPKIINEAKCLTSHSCVGVESVSSLESIPISIKMPVLKKDPNCSPYSLEFETVNIACICATSRQS